MIWLIGCKGMLGTEVSRQLTENNIEFIGTDIDVDITDLSVIRKFTENKKIQWIINCAAYTAVDKAETEIELATKLNKDSPRNIATVAKEIGAKFIHISTDYVFDGTGNIPKTENMPIGPIGVYGKTKAEGECEIRKVMTEYFIIRTAWLYGWSGKNFVYTMIKAMNTHDSVKVVNDQFGTPTFAGDLASVILQIVIKESSSYGTYHCTDIGAITWWDFTNEIKKQCSQNGILYNTKCIVQPCLTSEYPTPAKRPAYSVLDKTKIQNELCIVLPDWKDSLRVFLDSDLFEKTRIE